MSKSSVTRAGIGYTIANVLIRGIGFLTLPIFSRLLDTYDFGVYNVFLAYDSILFVVIGFALHSSLKSANWEFPSRIDEYVSSISLVYVICLVFLVVVVAVLGSFISEIAGLEVMVLLALIVHSFGSAIVALYNSRVSLQYSYRKYMIVAAGSSLGNVALSLVLIFTICNNQRYMGRILGATFAFAVLGVILLLYFWKKAKPAFNRKYWKFGIRYSLPIVAHGLSQVVLAQFGRLMINYMVSTVAAGIYGLAANLMVVVSVLTDSISTVWDTWFYETLEGEDAEKATAPKEITKERLCECSISIQKRAGQLAMGFSIPCIVLLSLTPELIWALGGDAYMDGAYCAFGMILSGYCVFLYNLIVVGEYYKQKTHYIMIGTMSAAVINVMLNFFAIEWFGYVSVAYSTLISYIFYVSFHWFICRRLIGFSILKLKTVIVLSMALCACVLLDVAFFDEIFIRIAIGFLIACPVIWTLLRSVGGIKGIHALLRR